MWVVCLCEFYQVRDELSVEQGLLLLRWRIVIQSLLRAEILERIHMGHLGIHKCRETARRNVWWPCMSSQIAGMISACRKCQRNRPEHSEPLIPLEFPERPWEHIWTYMFHWHNSEYLIAVDYHSRFFEVAQLQRTDSESIIEQLKSFFARHGLPEVVMSDNGPQYAARHSDNSPTGMDSYIWQAHLDIPNLTVKLNGRFKQWTPYCGRMRTHIWLF